MFKNSLLKVLLLLIIVVVLNCRDTIAPENNKVRLLWKKELPSESPVATPSAGFTISSNTLYFADTYSKFYSIGLGGDRLSEFKMSKGSITGVPVIRENLVVVGTSTAGAAPGYARLFALNKSTLETVWVKDNFVWHAVPAIDEVHVYCTDFEKAYAFDKASGQEVWSQTIFGKNVYNPVIDGDRLYFATGSIFQQDGYLYCLNKLTGEIVFQDTLPYMESRSQIGGSSAGVEIWGNCVYVPADNRYIYCFDKVTGKLKWKFLADAPIQTPPRISAGILYTGSLNRTCYAINAETGVLIWSYQTVGSIRRDPPRFYREYVLFVSGAILIFDKKSGDLITELTARTGAYGYFAAAWHTDGKIFAGGYDKNSNIEFIFAYQF